MPEQPRRWRFWIDRGGTFTDCIGCDPSDGSLHTAKLLSSDRAPLVGIRQLLGLPQEAPIPACDIRMGTTLATNALLERRGASTALVTTVGFGDLLRIGDQTRPDLFALDIVRPEVLYDAVLELPARMDRDGVVLQRPDRDATLAPLRTLRNEGMESVAIALLHAHRNGELELQVEGWARDAGFEDISVSHVVAGELGLLARTQTCVVDAYLTPLIQRYVDSLLAELPGSTLRIMQSSGGLTDAQRFRGRNAILSGPAGGVVACADVARQQGIAQAIGFDMGGTSTDVSRYGGELERVFESRIAGIALRAPTMRIHTVAAGGGSICRYDGERFLVGPHSAGADPGPLCYGRPGASELALTDVNVALGRVQPHRFPFPLQPAPVMDALDRVAARVGGEESALSVAEGFFEVAIEHMAQAIRTVSVARGHDLREHAMVVFGGAGGQHACALARRLGITTLVFHPLAGVLSAYGMGVAEVSWHGERDAGARALSTTDDDAGSAFDTLERQGRTQLVDDGHAANCLRCERRVELRYAGTEVGITLGAEPWDGLRARFETEHRQRFGYARPTHPVQTVALRVEVIASGARPQEGRLAPAVPARNEPPATATLRVDGSDHEVPLLQRESLAVGGEVLGPALILEQTGTLVLEPGFSLRIDADGVITVIDNAPASARVDARDERLDPVRLEVFNNLFMSIAEQMGMVLRRTALSTNIRERLDFSCAVFDGEGGLVANAPHIPVHLGAMGESVRAVVEQHGDMRPGDVFATNDPAMGGSHIPDVTVVTPVFDGHGQRIFFTASRGHHSDIGGTTPGSMPPFSTRLDEEGVVLRGLRIVCGGVMQHAELETLLTAGPYPARDPAQNIADLEAQVAANRRGDALLRELVEHRSLPVTQAYMGHVQQNAERRVRSAIAQLPDGSRAFTDAMDDGSAVCVRIDVAGDHMTIDFAGTAPQSDGNLNAPRAVTVAAVLYVLRTLVAEPIPLNSGCLRAVTLHVPDGSMLSPGPQAAVVAGNVETSQRIVDVLLGALGKLAACQGTMNNLTFGDAHFGYYETIAGGAGAGADFDGASGVHTHMTNTRITDPEVLETRFPVRLWRFALRHGSGGAGRRRGGDGVVRELEALAPLSASLLCERRIRAPFGLAGGQDGMPGKNLVNGRVVPGRAEIALETGDRIRIETPGGGGYGNAD